MVRNLIGINGYMCSRSPCGAGDSIIMVDEKGDIYPCEEMYGKNDFIIANVEDIGSGKEFEKILSRSPAILKLKERRIENIPRCKNCIWRSFCGGGCPMDSLSMFDSLEKEDVMCQYKQIMFKEILTILKGDINNVVFLAKPEKI